MPAPLPRPEVQPTHVSQDTVTLKVSWDFRKCYFQMPRVTSVRSKYLTSGSESAQGSISKYNILCLPEMNRQRVGSASVHGSEVLNNHVC